MPDGRVAMVTGAAGPAGRAVARALAVDGMRLALVGTRLERLNTLAGEVAEELALPADVLLARAADLRDAAAAQRVVDEVVARFGRLDVLVHLVGGWMGGTAVVDLPDADVAAMLEQHLWTTLHAVRAVVPHMMRAGWGRVVAVSSPVAVDPPAKSGAYAVGKAAMETLLAGLARETAGTGITVNILRVRTIDAAHERDSAASPGTAAWTTPEEIAAAVRYICSDGAGVVSGARLSLFGAR